LRADFAAWLSGRGGPLQLREHIAAAAAYNLEKTDPATPEKKKLLFDRNPVWFFVVAIRAHPELKDLQAMEAFQTVNRELKAEYNPDGSAPTWAFVSRERFGLDALFLQAWESVRMPAGKRPLQIAYDRAMVRDIVLGVREVGLIGLVVAIAAELQLIVGNANIILPVRALADVLRGDDDHCDKNKAGAIIGMAVACGYLEKKREAQIGTPSKQKPRRAAEFRFNLEKIDWQNVPPEFQHLKPTSTNQREVSVGNFANHQKEEEP
jgi:hypothetical protein